MSAAANSAAGGLSTPTLDAESSNILRSVSSHGGYAFVGMATLAAATGDIKAAEAARDMAWEQLHSGPWHSVLPVWRDAYSMACLHVAKSLYGKGGDYKDALRALDMGLIMGGPLLRDDLHAAVDVIVSSANNSESSETGDGGGGGGGRSSSSISSSSGSSVFQFQDSEFPPQPHHRSDDHAEVLRVLPIKSLSCKLVVKRSALSLEAFLREHLLPASPVIITDSMAHWPATTRWHDMDYLKRVAGDRTVPVEVGKNYLCQDWKQELISFSCFLERIQSIEFSSAVPTYLAQHPLFDQINELRKDICIPDYCFAGGGELRSLNAWFGPAGTVTPLHHDPHHNILAQVVGKKYFRLYPASLSEELYPYSETMLCNSSQVDLDNIDEREFPKVHDLEFMDCILEEGEMLYIPPRWWHYVRSLSTSFSVSFWWSDTGISNAF